VVRNEGLERATHCCRSGESSIAVTIDTLILEDTRIAAERRIQILGYAPAGVEEVEHILDIEGELQFVDGAADLHFEVVLVAKIETVDPRVVEAIGLCIFTLVL